MNLLLDTCLWGGARSTLADKGHDVIWTGGWEKYPGDRVSTGHPTNTIPNPSKKFAMADIDWDDINRFFYSTIELVKPYLPSDLVTEAVHFLSHDEHEMAIEGLLLTIVGFNLGHLVDLDRAEEIARILRLDEETVFDDNFWSKFLEYKQGIRR